MYIQAARRGAIFGLVVLSSYTNAASNKTYQPWLDQARPVEERLQAFMAQLNETQMYAMVQGDTVVS
jgi:beta-glucosidase